MASNLDKDNEVETGEIKNLTFNFQKSEKIPFNPHVAYTLAVNGGAASGYNKPVVLKANELEVSPEAIAVLKGLGVDTSDLEKVLEKGAELNLNESQSEVGSKELLAITKQWYTSIRSKLESAIEQKDFFDKCDWYYVEDFDIESGKCIVYRECEYYVIDFTMDGDNVVLGDVGKPVIRQYEWVETDGKVKLSEDKEKEIEMAVANGLLLKSVENNNARIKRDLLKNKEKETTMEIKDTQEVNATDVLKGVENNEQVQALIKQFEAQEALLKAQTAKLEAIEKARQKELSDGYATILKSYNVDEDNSAVLITKMLLDEDLANALIKTLETKHKELDEVKKSFGEEVGVDGKTNIDEPKDQSAKIKAMVAQLKAENK